MGALAVAALVDLALAALAFALGRAAAAPPRGVPAGGAALAMLLGTAATSEFVLRYLIPVVPLLVCGGIAAGRGPRRAGAQRGSKNSTTPTTTMVVEIATSSGGEVTHEQDQHARDEQREPGAHREARGLRARTARGTDSRTCDSAPCGCPVLFDSAGRSSSQSSPSCHRWQPRIDRVYDRPGW